MELEKLNRWKDDEFAPGSPAREKFERLCVAGCDAKLLLSFLTLAVFNASHKGTMYDIFGVSQSGVTKLPDELEQISRRIESINPILAQYLRTKFIGNSHWPDEIQSRCRLQIAVYQRTPDLLRLLADHLRSAGEWLNSNVGPKRYDTFRHSVLDLLSYVDNSTGSPHYEEVADLLSHLSSAREETLRGLGGRSRSARRDGEEKKDYIAPKLLSSSDALKALYCRSKAYGFRKAPPHSGQSHPK